jgi:hypothetical protein
MPGAAAVVLLVLQPEGLEEREAEETEQARRTVLLGLIILVAVAEVAAKIF